ncbi:DUF4383 domain-containing protein, partial [Streptomyces sp. NPDC055056]
TFGMYGRVSSKLPHDNPYWQRRHARQAARESVVDSRNLAPGSRPSAETSDLARESSAPSGIEGK